jgi:hypothetical protein
MAKIDGPKYLGALKVDLTAMADDMQDIAPGGLKGARPEKEGLQDVLLELAQAIPAHGDAAEIHPSVYQRVLHANKGIAFLTESVLLQAKLLEVSRESLARLVNNREEDLSSIAKSAEDKGEKGNQPEMLAHFEKTINYKSQFADKAVETRQKNEAAKTEADAEAKAKAAGTTPPSAGAGEVGGTPKAGTGYPLGLLRRDALVPSG